MRQSCRHASDAIRKLLFAAVKSLSKSDLDHVMAAVRECKGGRIGGPLYRGSFDKKLRELQHANKISSHGRHGIIETLFAD